MGPRVKTYSCEMCRPKLAGRRQGAPLLFTKGPRIGNGDAPRPPRRSSLCAASPPALCLWCGYFDGRRRHSPQSHVTTRTRHPWGG